MKTISKILAVIAAAACMAVVGIGCGPKGYVDKSNAVELGAFDRPDYAREMEEQHDREGREHIEIPDGAETITIDGEEYIPITKWSEIDQYNKNYILKCDISTDNLNVLVNLTNCKFHGNNYKIYGGTNEAIFGCIKNSIITNVICSSELQHDVISSHKYIYKNAILVAEAYDSVIKNCINYATTNYDDNSNVNGVISNIYDSTVENCYNYADMRAQSGLIYQADGKCVINNCYNYGNLSSRNSCGGILNNCGSKYDREEDTKARFADCTIKNSKNYGKIIGGSRFGGIVGYVDTFPKVIEGQEKNEVYEISWLLNKINFKIESCNNYGDIYRRKLSEEEDVRFVGGIAGIGYDITSSINHAHIYGFEALTPNITARYICGVTGAAISVSDCESKNEMQISPQVSNYDNICGYIIKK